MGRKKRGRKGKDGILGKRKRAVSSSDEDMEDVEQGENEIDRVITGRISKSKRNMTPSQRKISMQKILRERSASRREGHEPQRLAYKIVPEEHIRLARKINSVFKHKIERSEADRNVTCAKPKHMFSGKMSNGKKDWR